MSRRYYNKRGNDLTTDKIVDICVQIDNGLFDRKLDERDWYGKIEIFREEMIEVLLRRYRAHYVLDNKPNLSLDRAYETYLKYYID